MTAHANSLTERVTAPGAGAGVGMTLPAYDLRMLLNEARRRCAQGSGGTAHHRIDLASGEVAYVLGFSEPAPFDRAFKRWYGTTPEAFRSR